MNETMNQLSAATRVAVEQYGLDLDPGEVTLAVVYGVFEAAKFEDVQQQLMAGFLDAIQDAEVEFLEQPKPNKAEMAGHLLRALEEYEFTGQDAIGVLLNGVMMQLGRMAGNDAMAFSMAANTLTKGLEELIQARLLGMAGYSGPASMGGH